VSTETVAASAKSCSPISLTAAEAVCALGSSLEASLDCWGAGSTGLTTEDGLLAGRIADRSPLKGRRYGAASNLAVHVARGALAQAGWSAEQTRAAWLFAGSSRGNAGELLRANAWRRPSQRFSASNTMHSEIAAAVSIELGIQGPWQMLSNGCASGLDALGLAWMALCAGMTQRALVVAVDLPLLPELLRDFQETRLLSTNGLNDPLSPRTSGFIPGEAGVAITLEVGALSALAEVESYAANSDAYDSLVVPTDGAVLAGLLRSMQLPAFICPHATGTPNHAAAEANALRAAYPNVPPLLLLKPFTGHTLGASGLLDVALLAAAMRRGALPGNLAGLTAPDALFLPTNPAALPKSARLLKIASGMGGHNAVVMLRQGRIS